MKNINRIILGLAVVLSLEGCTKEVVQTVGKSLGTKDVSAAPGSFSMFIRTTGVWSVCTDSDWITVPANLFKDDSAVSIQYLSNESTQGDLRFNRLGHVIVKTYDGATADTLTLRQKGIEPFIAFSAENTVQSGSCYIPVFTNLGGAERNSIRITSDAAWIHDPEFGVDCKSLVFTADKGSGRQAEIRFSFTDSWGQVCSSICTIKQQED